MALDKFTITVDNIHTLPDDFVLMNTNRYGSSNNVVYAADITATALKQNVIVEEKIVHVHIVHDENESFIDYNDLTEDIVINWITKGLDLMRGANSVTTLQNTMEESIDKIILNSTPSLPWKK